MGGGGRHLLGTGGLDALDDKGLQRVAGRDGRTGAAGLDGFVSDVEAEVRHAGAMVGAVAAEAGIGEDGADVAVKAYFGVEREDGEEEESEQTHGTTII